ncbi:DUF4386 domain-containing protein [Hymenobacter sp. DG25B]|uniref:DUF4386 domain-containing protein n=1 Tax=Hymenobacter sp. DG25B TaxID=1385664 RepID=UPI001E537E1E|nr:DUF4386 domain-containing protein [Hymenobacter sp. DG25B]
MFIRGKIIVSGDAAATAHNLIASEGLWRAGIAGDLLMHLLDILVMLVFYLLLRTVNKKLALMALLFNLIQTAVLVANKITLLVPLFFLGNAAYLKAFSPQQLQALAYTSIKAHDYGFGIGLIFFGFTCLLNGYLIRNSGFLPRFIGSLMQIAGACYLINSVALILDPSLASRLFPFILLPPFVAELIFSLWLLIKGIDIAKWQEKASRW